MNLVKFLLLACLLGSCASNLNQNLIKEGTLEIGGGVYKNDRWPDALEFKRVSWYQELTLLFETMIAPIASDSPFYSWASRFERDELNKCSEKYILISYESDTGKISAINFKRQFKEQGFEQLEMPQFKSYLKNHPDFTRHSLNLFKVYAICKKSHIAMNKSLEITFPSFRPVNINP